MFNQGQNRGAYMRTPLGIIVSILLAACSGGSDNSNSSVIAGQSGASGSSAGSSGSGGSGAGAGGDGGSSGSNAGSGGSGGDAGSDPGGSSGSSGTAGNSGTAGAGGSPCGEAGHGSTTNETEPGCAGSAGNSGTAGSAGTSGSNAGTSGSSGTAGVGGSSGVGGAGQAGAGGSGSAGTSGSNAGTSGSSGTAGVGGSSGVGGAGQAGVGGEPGGSSGVGGSGSAGSNAGTSGSAGSAAGVGGSSGVGGAGQAGSAGSAGSSAGSAGTGSAGSAGSGGQVQNTFSCNGLARNAALDAANVNQCFVAGGIWGTSLNNFYVTLGLCQGNVASFMSCNGSSCTESSMPGNAPELSGIWGTSDTDMWIAGRNSKGVLFHKSGSSWADDVNKPLNAKDFRRIWGSDADNVWLLGTDKFVKQSVWRHDGTSWAQQALPVLPLGSVLTRFWGVSGHIFVVGYTNDTNSSPNGGILLHFDGSSWQQLNVPVEVTEFSSVHGTSVNELVIGGRVGQTGVVYQLADLTTWKPTLVPETEWVGTVWSKRPGTFWATGHKAAVNGSLRVITSDKSGVQVTPIDGLAYSATDVWPVPGTNQVMFVNTALGGLAGLYSGTCD